MTGQAKKVDSGLKFFAIVILAAVGLTVCDSFAARRSYGGGGSLFSGDFSFSLVGASSNANQEQINTLITRANARAGEGPIGNGQLTSGYEFGAAIGYRYSGTIYELQFRPTYFFQESKGGNNAGDSYKYGVTAFTFIPLFRLYPLENDYMRFFMQLGLGYGILNGTIQEGSAQAEFSGGTFGGMAGLGTMFCFTPSHCMLIEANYRYMNVERNIAKSSSGDFSAKGNSLSQYGTNQEVEVDGSDLQTRLSGLMFVLGYTYHF